MCCGAAVKRKRDSRSSSVRDASKLGSFCSSWSDSRDSLRPGNVVRPLQKKSDEANRAAESGRSKHPLSSLYTRPSSSASPTTRHSSPSSQNVTTARIHASDTSQSAHGPDETHNCISCPPSLSSSVSGSPPTIPPAQHYSHHSNTNSVASHVSLIPPDVVPGNKLVPALATLPRLATLPTSSPAHKLPPSDRILTQRGPLRPRTESPPVSPLAAVYRVWSSLRLTVGRMD